MAKHDYSVASVDINKYIQGIGDLVIANIKHGYDPYMLSFMYGRRHIGPSRQIAMKDEVQRVYSRFLTECVRNPNSPSNRYNKPILIGCPDWPVFKRHKVNRVKGNLPGDGAHWGAILLVPPRNRLGDDVKDHFEATKRSAYVRSDTFLSRIHVEPVTYDIRNVVGYTFKSLSRRRCEIDDILILPRSASEISHNRRNG